MRRSYKSRRSEVARIVAFDPLVRERILLMHPQLVDLDITVIMCGDVLEKTEDHEMWRISEMVHVSKLSFSSIRNSKRRLLKIGYLDVFEPSSHRFGLPKHYCLTGVGSTVVTSHNTIMIPLLEEKGAGYDLFALEESSP